MPKQSYVRMFAWQVTSCQSMSFLVISVMLNSLQCKIRVSIMCCSAIQYGTEPVGTHPMAQLKRRGNWLHLPIARVLNKWWYHVVLDGVDNAGFENEKS